MKILVTGAEGQLSKDLIPILEGTHEVFGLGRNELDVTNLSQVQHICREIKPEVIIHCAAYTAVDMAESDETKAYLVNTLGSRNMAIAAEEHHAKICLISTDYVFDGTSKVPYKEYDQPNPVNVYGKTKYAGEHSIQSLSRKYFIVRTSWLYGMHGGNFVKTMIGLAKENRQLKVVSDQCGSPTYTVDLAQFLADLIVTDQYGIYHATNSGDCSWFDFAKAIFEEMGLNVQVNSSATEEFPRPARRPQYSVLDNLAIRANGFKVIRHWREGLKAFVEQYKEQYHE